MAFSVGSSSRAAKPDRGLTEATAAAGTTTWGSTVKNGELSSWFQRRAALGF
jgi:hypothetical protein